MNKNQQDFIYKILPGVIETYKKYDINIVLSLVQAIHESNWGTSELATKANNLFGIKYHVDNKYGKYEIYTDEWIDGVKKKVKVFFKKYDSWEQSINHHGEYLATRKINDKLIYSKVISAKDDYKTAIKEVHKAKYATDPEYSNKMLTLVDEYKLYEYEEGVNMSKINGVPYYQKQIIANRTAKIRTKSDIKAIVIHYTANYSKGSDAEMHYQYWYSTNRNSSCDVVIDDHSIWKINDWYKYYMWQIGDGKGKYGWWNKDVIGIEMCVNEDGNFNITVENTIAYIRYLHENGFTKKLIRHYDASRKLCPKMFIDLNIVGWNKAYIDFRNKVYADKKELYDNMLNTKWMYDNNLIFGKDYKSTDKFTVEQIGTILKRFKDKFCK